MNILIKRFIKNYQDVDNATVRNDYGKFSSVMGIIFNVILFTIKLIAGLLSGSVAIVADAVNNLSDASSSIISFIGFKLASKPADADHPYGHGRYEHISALLVACLVLAIGIEILKSSIEKIIHPTDINASIITIVILVISILVKLYMMYFNTKTGKLIKSKTLIATAQDSRNDVISTGAVLLSIIISFAFNLNLDGIMGVLVAIFILVSGLMLVKDTLDPILGIAPEPETVKTISDLISSYEYVLGIHDLIIHDYGPGNTFASVHCEVDSKIDVLLAHDQIDNIERDVFEKTNIHLVIHYDPIVTDDGITMEIREKINTIVKGIKSNMSIHDVRVVPGPTHTNIVFDIVVPHDVTYTQKELRQMITSEVRKINPKYICVITFDLEYASYEQH
ncbi:MAG: cation diffusion facilitator family transporter [Clostridia bacterium]|nr:cation diffusion facilitator family transporter [Clostridia bacterium]